MAHYAPAPTKTFEPAPAGLHPAVCVDFVDDGFKQTQYGEKHKVHYVFQIAERNEAGKRFLVSAWFNYSMHENSSLRGFLGQWRGRPFTDEELSQPPGFDFDSVIGKPCTINIVHNVVNGKTYANITGIAKHDHRLGEPLQPENYIRVEEREQTQQAARAAIGQTTTPAQRGDDWDDANPVF